MYWRRDFRSYVASTCLHAVVLASLCGVPLAFAPATPPVSIEAVNDEAEDKPVVAQAETFVSVLPANDGVGEPSGESSVGGLVSGVSGVRALRSSGRAVHLDAIPKMGRGPAARIRPIIFTGTAADAMADDLGERIVKGEASAPVGNYQQALSRIAKELIRLMREGPVLAVWLFDESESMRDDQAEIRAQFQKVYEEIGLETAADRSRKSKSKQAAPLLSAVVGFGEHVHSVTARPTSDLRVLKKAI